ncbi:hypothetical protein [Pseudoroseicyclus tamaricis]|uniref:Antifreeze glycopeptide polyprotein n=1 Tax=Pseudoroseicyclus tamaricis TaxID=2705421 RepID=A0A6B2JJC3_9RHOB|nr:hypothetical protein [Pseudoroseicyclus tamaricis]NDV01531.1 hypothetical protein [Pseudoroseicyclus tamaricis]
MTPRAAASLGPALGLALLLALPPAPTAAQQQAGGGGGDPLSAIDWLSRSVAVQPTAPTVNEPPVAESGAPPEITVTPLDDPSLDAVGLYGPAETGLPRSLWAGSEESLLVTLIAAERRQSLPAIDDLLTLLLLARADPPRGAGAEDAMFLARIDKLLDLARLEEAEALIGAAGVEHPAAFRRWFDISLLMGTENVACAQMQTRPALAPTLPARVFCLARQGDWNAAALTLGTARAIGAVSDAEEELLTRFLDPAIAEDSAPLAAPDRLSPLIFRLYEAIGEGMPTASLPLAFAHAELRGLSAWRTEVEAAERLARAGAIPPQELARIYLSGTPAASGGIWERVDAVQVLDRALDRGDDAALADALPLAAELLSAVHLQPALARLVAPRLAGRELPPPAAATAFRLALLTDAYEEAAQAYEPQTEEERFLAAIARGDASAIAGDSPRQRAVVSAFTGLAPPEVLTGLVAEDRLGEALLRAIALFNEGLSGDPQAVAEALAFFRTVGLEDVARQTALQYLILEAVV